MCHQEYTNTIRRKKSCKPELLTLRVSRYTIPALQITFAKSHTTSIINRRQVLATSLDRSPAENKKLLSHALAASSTTYKKEGEETASTVVFDGSTRCRPCRKYRAITLRCVSSAHLVITQRLHMSESVTTMNDSSLKAYRVHS